MGNFKRFSSIIILKGYNLWLVVSDQKFTKNLPKIYQKFAENSLKKGENHAQNGFEENKRCFERVNEAFFG